MKATKLIAVTAAAALLCGCRGNGSSSSSSSFAPSLDYYEAREEARSFYNEMDNKGSFFSLVSTYDQKGWSKKKISPTGEVISDDALYFYTNVETKNSYDAEKFVGYNDVAMTEDGSKNERLRWVEYVPGTGYLTSTSDSDSYLHADKYYAETICYREYPQHYRDAIEGESCLIDMYSDISLPPDFLNVYLAGQGFDAPSNSHFEKEMLTEAYAIEDGVSVMDLRYDFKPVLGEGEVPEELSRPFATSVTGTISYQAAVYMKEGAVAKVLIRKSTNLDITVIDQEKNTGIISINESNDTVVSAKTEYEAMEFPPIKTRRDGGAIHGQVAFFVGDTLLNNFEGPTGSMIEPYRVIGSRAWEAGVRFDMYHDKEMTDPYDPSEPINIDSRAREVYLDIQLPKDTVWFRYRGRPDSASDYWTGDDVIFVGQTSCRFWEQGFPNFGKYWGIESVERETTNGKPAEILADKLGFEVELETYHIIDFLMSAL